MSHASDLPNFTSKVKDQGRYIAVHKKCAISCKWKTTWASNIGAV